MTGAGWVFTSLPLRCTLHPKARSWKKFFFAEIHSHCIIVKLLIFLV
jgi:hypothetical protein